MATARRFYSWVWRINGLLLLALAVGGVAMLVWVGAPFFKPASRAPQSETALQVEPGKVDTSGAQLGKFQSVPGTGLLQAALELPRGRGSLYSKGVAPIRNYYFFDPSSHAGHWLIPDYRGLIAETDEFPAKHVRGGDDSAAEVVVYQLVDADSNGDGTLNEADLMTLAVADAKGGNFVRLLTKVQSFKGIHLVGKRTLAVIFTSEGQMRAAQVDLDTGKIVRQSVLKL